MWLLPFWCASQSQWKKKKTTTTSIKQTIELTYELPFVDVLGVHGCFPIFFIAILSSSSIESFCIRFSSSLFRFCGIFSCWMFVSSGLHTPAQSYGIILCFDQHFWLLRYITLQRPIFCDRLSWLLWWTIRLWQRRYHFQANVYYICSITFSTPDKLNCLANGENPQIICGMRLSICTFRNGISVNKRNKHFYPHRK